MQERVEVEIKHSIMMWHKHSSAGRIQWSLWLPELVFDQGTDHGGNGKVECGKQE